MFHSTPQITNCRLVGLYSPYNGYSRLQYNSGTQSWTPEQNGQCATRNDLTNLAEITLNGSEIGHASGLLVPLCLVCIPGRWQGPLMLASCHLSQGTFFGSIQLKLPSRWFIGVWWTGVLVLMFANVSKKDLREYYEDLEFRRNLDPSEHRVIENHYYRLGVVDSKTAALLQYDGIILATLAILLTAEYESVRVNAPYEIILFVIALTLSLFATLTLLSSINLHWRVVCSRMTLEELHDSLIRSTIKRTIVYRRALGLSRLSGFFLAVLFYLILLRSGLFEKAFTSIIELGTLFSATNS